MVRFFRDWERRRKKLNWAGMNKNKKSPCEIKRREVSWTLRKKLAQKRSRAWRWCWARERGVDFFCFCCFPTAELQTLSS